MREGEWSFVNWRDGRKKGMCRSTLWILVLAGWDSYVHWKCDNAVICYGT